MRNLYLLLFLCLASCSDDLVCEYETIVETPNPAYSKEYIYDRVSEYIAPDMPYILLEYCIECEQYWDKNKIPQYVKYCVENPTKENFFDAIDYLNEISTWDEFGDSIGESCEWEDYCIWYSCYLQIIESLK